MLRIISCFLIIFSLAFFTPIPVAQADNTQREALLQQIQTLLKVIKQLQVQLEEKRAEEKSEQQLDSKTNVAQQDKDWPSIKLISPIGGEVFEAASGDEIIVLWEISGELPEGSTVCPIFIRETTKVQLTQPCVQVKTGLGHVTETLTPDRFFADDYTIVLQLNIPNRTNEWAEWLFSEGRSDRSDKPFSIVNPKGEYPDFTGEISVDDIIYCKDTDEYGVHVTLSATGLTKTALVPYYIRTYEAYSGTTIGEYVQKYWHIIPDQDGRGETTILWTFSPDPDELYTTSLWIDNASKIMESTEHNNQVKATFTPSKIKNKKNCKTDYVDPLKG